MSGWNFAELWEAIAERFGDADALVQGDRRLSWSEIDRRANGVATTPARRRRRAPGQGGPVPLQLPRVHGGLLRRLQGGPGAGEHQLPLPRRRAGLPVGQRRRHRRGLPRHPSPTGSRRCATGCRRSAPGSGSTTATATARTGPRPTRRRRDPPPSGPSAPGGAQGDDILMIYTGGTTGMPKGVMWRQDDLIRATVLHRQRRFLAQDPEEVGGVDGAPRRAGAGRVRRAAGLPAHARHRLVHRQHLPDPGRLGRVPRGPPPRRDRAARHHRAGGRRGAHHRGRRLRQADRPGTRRRARTAGTSRASCSSPPRASCGARAPRRACWRITPACS